MDGSLTDHKDIRPLCRRTACGVAIIAMDSIAMQRKFTGGRGGGGGE